jgi:hypothetical protein
MALIGNIVIGMETNTAGFKKGLGEAGASLKSFGAGLKTLGPPLLKVGDTLAGLGVAGAAGLAALAASSADALDKLHDTADRIGLTTESLGELRYAAKLTGSETEAMDGALAKMNVNLGNAARAGGPAADALNRLGLDAKELSRLDPAEAFKKIIGGLSGLDNTFERASVAQEIFGKGAVGIMGTIKAGPEEVARLSEEFARLSGNVSALDVDNIGKMFDSTDRVQVAMTGLGNKIAATVAPAVEQLANGVADFVAAAKREDIEAVFVGVAMGAAIAADSIRLAADEANSLAKQVSPLYDLITKVQGMSGGLFGGSAGEALSGALGEKSLTQQLEEKLAAMEAIKGARDVPVAGGKPTDKATSGITEEHAKADEKVKELTKSLEAELATWGKSAYEADLYKLKLEGATDAQIESLRTLEKRKEALQQERDEMKKTAEANRKIEEDRKAKAHDVYESTRTPQEKLAEKENELKGLRASGAIDFETFRRGTQSARQEYASGQAGKGPALIEHGSQESYSAMLRHEQGFQTKDDKIKDVAQNTAEQVRQQADILNVLNDMLRAFNGGGADVPGDFAPFNVGA